MYRQALTCMVTCSYLHIIFLSLFLGFCFVKRDANLQAMIEGLD